MEPELLQSGVAESASQRKTDAVWSQLERHHWRGALSRADRGPRGDARSYRYHGLLWRARAAPAHPQKIGFVCSVRAAGTKAGGSGGEAAPHPESKNTVRP